MKPSVGIELCEALGLNPDTVTSLTIHLEAGHIARATAQHLIDTDRATEVLRHYRLTWAPPADEPDDDPFDFLATVTDE